MINKRTGSIAMAFTWIPADMADPLSYLRNDYTSMVQSASHLKNGESHEVYHHKTKPDSVAKVVYTMNGSVQDLVRLVLAQDALNWNFLDMKLDYHHSTWTFLSLIHLLRARILYSV